MREPAGRRIYLDHHATTPVDPRVLAAMIPFFSDEFGNPSSHTHGFGWRAEKAVEAARASLARAIGAQPDEIVFTSGATESTNLAIQGVLRRNPGKHLVVSAIEHPAVLDTARAFEAEGIRVTRVRVGAEGIVDPEEVRAALAPDTVLVSVMHANNEIGTLQPVAEIGRLCKEREVLFHVDAAQSLGKIPIDVEAMGIDLMSLSAHKIYGPKGIGALFVRNHRPRVRLAPLLHGGGQEGGRRAGTLNVPGIVGMARAVEIALDAREEESARLLSLRERLRRGIEERIGLVRINGSLKHRLPGNLNVSFEHVEGEALCTFLADRGVAVSTGSACASAHMEASHVLKALGLTEPQVFSSIRFGLGRGTTVEDVETVLELLREGVERLRRMNPLYSGSGGAERRDLVGGSL